MKNTPGADNLNKWW